MKILELYLHNFQAIGDARIPMDNQGTILITGWNKDDPSTRSNGSGKSSLVSDGLTYALFGKTLKGLVGSDVVNRFSDGHMEVAITFQDEEERQWQIVRKRKGKSASVKLYLQGEMARELSLGRASETQAFINELIGMDFVTFTCSVIFGQGMIKTFSAMSDADQKRIFTKILDLEEIEKWGKSARQADNKVEQRKSELLIDIEKTTGILGQAKENQAELKNARTEWKEKQARKIETAEEHAEDIGLKLAERELLEHRKKALQKKVGDLEAKIEVQTETEVDFKTKNEKAVEAFVEAGKIEVAARTKMDDAKEDIDAFDSLGPECDQCHQEVPDKHIDRIRKKLRDDYDKTKRFHKGTVDDTENLKGKAARVQERHSVVRENLKEHELNLSKSEFFLKTCKTKLTNLDSIEDDLADAFNVVTALKKEKFAARSAVSSLAKKVPALRASIKKDKSEVKKLESEMPYLGFWREAFSSSGLPSFLLDSIAPFVSDRAMKYSKILTGGKVYIEFQPVSQLKSGDYRDKFRVLAINESGSDVYAGNSEGEKGKIDLCVGLALQDLVRSKAKTRVNVVVFDEATKNMDLASAERFIELIDSRLVTAETKFIVTHNREFRGYFEDQIRVVKKNGIAKVKRI